MAPSSLILYRLHVWSSADLSLHACSSRSTKTFMESSDTFFFNCLSVLKQCFTFAASMPLISPPIFKPAITTVFFSSGSPRCRLRRGDARRLSIVVCAFVFALFLGCSSSCFFSLSLSSSPFSFSSSSSSSCFFFISRLNRFLSLKSTFSFSFAS